MKILRVIATIDPKTGGPIEGLKRASRVMIDNSVQVEVASLDSPGTLQSEVRDAPWPIHRLGPHSLGHYAYARRFRKWLLTNLKRFDAVIIHGLWQYHGFATAKACRELNVPYYIYPHGMLDPWFNQAYPLKRLKKLLYWWWGEHPVLANAKAVLFTSEEECRLARESFRPYHVKEKVIGYGTAAPDIDIGELKQQMRESPPDWAARPFFLFLGRIQEKKGIDLLVEAYVGLKASGKPVPDLVIAGPVQQENYARRIRESFPQEGIHWIGPLSGEEKWRALVTAEALVLVSHQENFGLVVAEALAAGTPVLISDKVNIWREIVAGGAGFAGTDSLEGACGLLDRWTALPPEEKEIMATAARKVFKDNFEIRAATERLIAYLGANTKSKRQ